jgi:hypothetical protein
MDSHTDYKRYDSLGLARLVKDGSVSADELLEAAIERVEQRAIPLSKQLWTACTINTQSIAIINCSELRT